MLAAVVNETARQFARAIVMPNLDPPVTTVVAAEAYRARIMVALAPGVAFTPLMTAYLTDAIDPGEIGRGFRSGVFTAAKLLSRITLSDGLVIAAFDGLPSSASRLP